MSDVKVRLERLDAGWAVLQLEAPHAACVIDASFVGGRDFLEDLAHWGTSVRRSAPMEVWAETEPAQGRLAVEPLAPEQVSVTVHWFRGGVRRQPRDLGDPAFEAQCNGTDLARQVRNIFSVWKNEASEYERRWHHPFPTRAFGLLEEALAS